MGCPTDESQPMKNDTPMASTLLCIHPGNVECACTDKHTHNVAHHTSLCNVTMAAEMAVTWQQQQKLLGTKQNHNPSTFMSLNTLKETFSSDTTLDPDEVAATSHNESNSAQLVRGALNHNSLCDLLWAEAPPGKKPLRTWSHASRFPWWLLISTGVLFRKLPWGLRTQWFGHKQTVLSKSPSGWPHQAAQTNSDLTFLLSSTHGGHFPPAGCMTGMFIPLSVLESDTSRNLGQPPTIAHKLASLFWSHFLMHTPLKEPPWRNSISHAFYSPLSPSSMMSEDGGRMQKDEREGRGWGRPPPTTKLVAYNKHM